jgi:hypothetical protein
MVLKLKNISIIAFMLSSIGIIVWWFNDTNPTIHKPVVNLPNIEISNEQPLSEKKVLPAKELTVLPKPHSADIPDQFDIALDLLEFALQGDAASQLKLGRILDVCMKVVYERDTLQNNLKLLYAYENIIPEHVLSDLESVVQGCASFQHENLQLFYPKNESHLNQANFSDKNYAYIYLPYYWIAQAAAAGDESAMVDSLHMIPIPAMMSVIDKPSVQEILDKKLSSENPDILFNTGLCVPFYDMSTRVALIEMACDKSSDCRGIRRHSEYQISGLLSLSSINDNSTDIESFENNLSLVSLPKMIEKSKKSDLNFDENKKNLKIKLKDESFRKGLIENCASIMRHPVT